jgi:16S rRNA C967 or C1407 C5-methylase (RsmB/RsmF family)/NOL1/NOP2/fmu family ribosome biogenesis protein
VYTLKGFFSTLSRLFFMMFSTAFTNRMQAQLALGWPLFVGAHAQPAPVSIRHNHKKKKESNGYENRVPWTQHGIYLAERPSFTLDPAFHAGAYYVQEASSMLLEQAVHQTIGNQQTIRALDLCAAPGGKSTHLLDLLSNESLLVTNEVIRSRATILAENITKWGRSNVVVTNSDPEDFQRLPGYFDLVVVDAPCSGEGLFRKDAEAMTEWSEDNAALCSSRQQRIVHDVWPALKEHGILIYCTCTYNPEENDKNVERFTNELEAEVMPLRTEKTWGVQSLKYGYQCYPHHVQGEGFYIAILRKKTRQPNTRVRPSKTLFSKPAKVKTDYASWLENKALGFVQFKELLLTAPSHLLTDIEFISSQLKTVSAGTTIGSIKHDKVIPEHALALSIDLSKDLTRLAVSAEDALTYLRKDVLWKEGVPKGFTLVTHQGLALGWVNALDNRFNNHYPPEWRIRMR